MRATALRTYRELLQAAWVREVPVGPVDETLARVGQILRDGKIPFAVVGGFAVIEHGYERFTKDVDVLVYKAGASVQGVARYIQRAWPKLLPRFRELVAQARAELKPRPRHGPDPSRR